MKCHLLIHSWDNCTYSTFRLFECKERAEFEARKKMYDNESELVDSTIEEHLASDSSWYEATGGEQDIWIIEVSLE